MLATFNQIIFGSNYYYIFTLFGCYKLKGTITPVVFFADLHSLLCMSSLLTVV